MIWRPLQSTSMELRQKLYSTRRRSFSQRLLLQPIITLTTVILFIKIDSSNCQTTVSNKVVEQTFALSPTNKRVNAGTDVLLPCRVLNRKGTIQWTRDGFGLGQERNLGGFPRYSMSGSDEEENFSLTISKVTLEDDAVFQCQVGAAEGVKGIRSNDAILTVNVQCDRPKIVQGDFLQTTAGVTVELSCEANGGRPAADITWLDENGVAITQNIEIYKHPMADGKRYTSSSKWTLTPGRQHDGKTFTCRSESLGFADPYLTYIKLEVKYPPEITLKVDSNKIIEFDTVVFTCDAMANPSDVVYKWFRNDEIISSGHGPVLTFEKVTRDFNKNVIICQVGNSVGTTQSKHILNVHYGPVIKTKPVTSENLAVELGQKVKLLCDVDGNPKPEIVWNFENTDKVLSTKKELTIKEMTPNLAGKYTCKATVPDFPESILEMRVYIKGPPRITSPEVQYGVEGEVVRLECLITSVPQPSRVMWSKNFKVVDIDNTQGIEIVQQEVPNGVLNSLVFRKASESDFGQYNCSVWNPFGQHSVLFSLQRQKSLPMLIILAGVIGGIVFIVSVTIVIILCLRRKSIVKDDDYSSEKKTKQSDSGSSGDSDLKVEIRTASSLSNAEHERSWEDNSDTTRVQDVQDIYKYASEYNEPAFPPKPETQNNNGYIPYVDYSRDYNPPPSSVQLTPSRDTTYDSASHQSLNDLAPIVDPRYSASYANPYLRASQNTLPPPQGVYVSPRGSMASGGGGGGGVPGLGHGRYITAQQSHLKPGTLATHV